MTSKPSYQELLNKVENLERRIETHRTLVDNSSDLFYRTDLEGRLSYVSPSVYRISGYTVEEAIGIRLAEEIYLFPQERTVFLEKLREDGQVCNFEAQLKRKDGSIWWASASAHFLNDKDGKTLGVEGNIRDITELKTIELSLRASEERFRLAFQTSPDSINLNRVSDGLYLDTNQGFTDLTGYAREDVIGKTSHQINIWKTPADRQRLIDGLMETGFVKNLEAQFVKKNGEVGVGLMSARTLKINDEDVILSVTRDITARKQAEEERVKLESQLTHAKKIEAIGRLAGGVAHDLNNLLSPILGYGELLLANMTAGDSRKKQVEQIVKAGTGAKDLVQQLLAFGRKQALKYKPMDLNETLTGFEKLLRRMIREDIEIDIIRAPHVPPIMADIGQIEQVIMNLAVNAADAMPDGGRLSLETALVALDEKNTDFRPNMKMGEYVMLVVSDTGCGMDKETSPMIFDPFFSTKGDQGTGLGLATVHGIVKQHEGNILVHSEPGKGATFKVFLPVTLEIHSQQMIPERKNIDLTGSETILVVEDNGNVRDIVSDILEKFGYSVLVAKNGVEALEIMAVSKESVALLLTDVVMPQMNGKELYDELIQDFPKLKVIYMSGYTDNAIVHRGVLDQGVHLIKKPFTVQGIISTIRNVLDEE